MLDKEKYSNLFHKYVVDRSDFITHVMGCVNTDTTEQVKLLFDLYKKHLASCKLDISQETKCKLELGESVFKSMILSVPDHMTQLAMFVTEPKFEQLVKTVSADEDRQEKVELYINQVLDIIGEMKSHYSLVNTYYSTFKDLVKNNSSSIIDMLSNVHKGNVDELISSSGISAETVGTELSTVFDNLKILRVRRTNCQHVIDKCYKKVQKN